MRKLLAIAAVVVLGIGATAWAEEIKSGPQVGDEVGAYDVTKAAGAPNDGVSVGMSLCYRCKLGQAPVVMVFARKPDAKLAKLTHELDKVVADNAEKKMGSFVSLLGSDAAALKKEAHEFVASNKLKNIAFVVPDDQPNGPKEYNLNSKADVTVLIYRNGKVAANHAFAAGGLNDEAIAKIVADTSKILN
ncbi:MAG TPA: hypothetical protein VFE24_01850 [Pirellulales bacterium]|jgi:hypothetical protein|nr:hypothetical protein [Pirellulales bacterium]